MDSADDESAGGHDSAANDEPKIVDDPAGVADPAHDDDDPAGVADPAHDDDDPGGVVDSAHHQDLAVDGPVEIHAPEEVLQLPAKRSSIILGRRLRRWNNLPSGLPGPVNPRSPWLPVCLW